MIQHIGAVGARAEKDIIALQGHDSVAVAVAEHDPFWRDRQRPCDQARRNVHLAFLSNLDASLFQQLEALLLIKTHTRSIQDLQAGMVEALYLIRREFSKFSLLQMKSSRNGTQKCTNKYRIQIILNSYHTGGNRYFLILRELLV